jgi:hypothetical protein
MASWGDLANKNRWGQPTKPKNQSYVTGQPNTVAPPPPAAKSPDTGLPIDPTYEATIGGLQRKRDDTVSQYEAQKPKVLADYGYTASGYDSSGAPTGLAFDPNNPFSRAALAKRTYDQTQAGTTNSMAARGQLYSGAREQATAGNEFQYQQGTDALLKALTSSLVGIQSGETNAKTDYELGAGSAYGDRITRAQNTPPSPPPTPTVPVGNPYPPGTNQWAAYAKQHGESWKQVNGKWKKVN